MNELVRSVGLLTTQRAVLLVLGAARTKIAASLLGPSGMGFLAQALALRDLLTAVSNLGTRNGYVKLVAEHHGRKDIDGLGRLVVTTVTLVAVLAAVMAGTSVLAARPIAEWAFGEDREAILVALVAVAVAFGVPAKLLARTFTGLLDYRSFLLIAVAESVVAILAMAALAYQFGVAGAVASFAVVEVVALGFAGVLLWRRVARPMGVSLRPRRPDLAIARQLLRLAGALAFTGFLAAGVAVFVRSEILRQLGAEANGYYQVAWQVGQNYLGLLGAALWGYGMPKVATKLQDPEMILELQNSFLRIVLAVLVPGVVALLATREIWIPILYSNAFLAASGVVAWQLCGELIAMARQSMNISLLPREKLRFLVAQATGYWGLWALLSVLALPHLGASAAGAGYFGANAIALGYTYAYHARVLGYRVDAHNRSRLAWTVPGAALAVAVAMGGDATWNRLLPIGLALVSVWWNRDVWNRLRAQRL